MKKTIAFLIILAAICLAENYNSSTEGTFGTGTAYFSPAVDSSWWLFSYPGSSNYYDTISGYADGDYQVIDSVDLDSIGVHLIKIYGFDGGAYSDSVRGVWEHRAPIDSAGVFAAIKHYFYSDSASADTGDGSIAHKLLSDVAGGGAPTVEQIYAEFIDGTNENAFKADVSNLDVAVSAARDDILDAIPSVSEIADGVWNEDTTGHNTANSYSEMLEDTIHYQGSASGLTGPEVADAVTDSLGFGIGAGDYSCSLYVLNSDDTTAIQSVWVTVYSSDGGTLYGRQDTGVDGLRIFLLDAEDSVIYYLVKNGVAFSIPEYISITGHQTDTIWGDVLNPAAATGDMVALQFYQLTPGYDTLSATKVEYKLIKDSTGTEFELTDRVTFGTGTSTIALSKSWNTANAQSGDTSYVTFSVFSNYDIRVNGVQDSTSYYDFIVRWKNGQETEAIKQIDKTSPQNPMAP